MSIFDTISKSVAKIFTRNDKQNLKISAEQVETLARLQKDGLNSVVNTLSVFTSSDMNSLYKKYLTNIRSNDSSKVGYIIPSFTKKFQSKALVEETKQVFGATLLASKNYVSILDEILKNFNEYIPEEGLLINNTKVSTIMILGVIYQAKFLNDYINYLWSHFTKTVVNDASANLPYQGKFLSVNYDKFITIVNTSCNRDSAKVFLNSIRTLKQKHADAFLYQDGRVFLTYADKNAYSGVDNEKIVDGLIGFNIVAHVFTWLDIFNHNEYLKKKMLKEKYESTVALMRYELMDVDEESPEYKILMKRIKQYEDKIASYDKKIQEYEQEDLL